MTNLKLKLLGAVGFAALALGGVPADALTMGPDFAADYVPTVLGAVPGITVPYGGLTFKRNADNTTDFNTLLVGGSANIADGTIYSIGVTRDGSNHITGFVGSASVFTDGAFNDGGVDYASNGVLFVPRWPENSINQTVLGSPTISKISDLAALGVVSPGPGGGTFVPSTFAGAGKYKIVVWSTGEFYTLTLVPDGAGTFDITAATLETVLDIAPADPDVDTGPEGFVYLKAGNPDIAVDSILLAEFSLGTVSAYEIDAGGNPIPGTRRIFIEDLTGAEGALLDPLTGDFLFTTFFNTDSSDEIVRVSGFTVLPPPPVPEPMSLALFGLGLAGLGFMRRRRAT